MHRAATSTRTGTAHIGWHLMLNMAPVTAYSGATAADNPQGSFASALPGTVTAFGPSRPTTGQIFPRGDGL